MIRRVPRVCRRAPKLLGVVAALLLIMTTVVFTNLQMAWATTAGATGPVADSTTQDGWNSILLGEDGKSSTRYAGRVWTDKSVTTNREVVFTGTGDSGAAQNEFTFTRSEGGDFLVTYSALATSQQITQLPKIPVDVVFVLDFSGSMNWGTRAEQVVGNNNQEGRANSRLLAMVNAMNETIDTLVKDNEHNRIGIAVFNGTASTLLPLTEVSDFRNVQDGQYLEITRFELYQSSTKLEANATVLCNINNESADTAGGTNIQAGMEEGMSMLSNVASTLYEYEGEQYTRIPNVVLMSDGAPTSWSPTENTRWYQVERDWIEGTLRRDDADNRYDVDSRYGTQAGDWWNRLVTNEIIGRGDTSNPHSADGFMALLTASYKKNQITGHYSDNANAQSASNAENAYCRVYNIGFSTDQQTVAMQEMVDIVLNPADHLGGRSSVEEINRLNEACDDYLNGTQRDVSVYGELGNNAGNYEYVVSHPDDNDPYDPENFNYPDEYFSAQNADDLNSAFQQITSAITDSAKVPTEVSGDDPFHGGYIVYRDPIGEYMEIEQINGLLYANTQFEVDSTTSIEDGVRYTLTNVDGSGTSNVVSELYGSHDVNEIIIDVLTDSNTGKQTLEVRIPAALIPLRVSYVEVNSDGSVKSNETNNVYPLRLVYEVGLAEGVVNDEGELNVGEGFDGAYDSRTGTYKGVSQDYAGAHKIDGTNDVGFYANYYSGKEQGSGDAAYTVGDATVEFTAASDNPFYFIQENTPLYTSENGERATGTIDPNAKYWFKVEFYEGTATRELWISRMGSMLGDSVDSDADGRLYIRKGSPRLGYLVDMVASIFQDYQNNTGTAEHPYYPTASNPENGTFTVYLGNNGRLSVGLPGPDVQPALQVTKTDASDAQKMLPNAVFAVYTDTNGNGTYDADENGDQMVGQSLTTDGNGVVSFAPDAHTFELGKTYFLVETEAPEGYQLMGGAVSIVFNENDGSDANYPKENHPFVATITFPGSQTATQYSGEATEGDTPIATIELTVADEPMPSLPVTGSTGRTVLGATGVAAVGVGAYAIWSKRRLFSRN